VDKKAPPFAGQPSGMRLIAFVGFALAVLVFPATAQEAVTLRADPVAIVDAEINGRQVRLEVDPTFPDVLALSAAAAQRLGVRRLPLLAAEVSIEGGSSMRARVARPRITFDGRAARNFAGIFPAPVSTRADGVIGPGSLPYDVITFELGPAPVSAREIVFPLENPDVWRVRAQVGGETLTVLFDIAHDWSTLNRPAARLFDARGAIPANGDLEQRQLVLGLSTLMQPVTTDLSMQGLSLGPTYARTLSPLLGALEEDAVVVEAEGSGNPPGMTFGRAALRQAGCSTISVDRRSRRLTLRCAG
jgi:hypothetical protein